MLAHPAAKTPLSASENEGQRLRVELPVREVPGLGDDRGGGVQAERVLLSVFLDVEDSTEEVRCSKGFPGALEVTGDQRRTPAWLGDREVRDSDAEPSAQVSAPVHDAAGAQPAAVSDPRAVEHHHLRVQVDGLAELTACQRYVRARRNC
jgi:hypothetical protein